MFKDIPQFVKQETCLSCQGCCRFDSTESSWRPKVGADEVYDWKRNLLKVSKCDSKGHLEAKSTQGGCECSYFNAQENKCTLYQWRPFECQLYPFLLYRKDDCIRVGFHWACPHMQDTFGEGGYDNYVLKLKFYFNDKNILKFIQNNQNLISDYSEFDKEIEDVFEIPECHNSSEIDLLNQRIKIESFNQIDDLKLSTRSIVALLSWREFFEYDIKEIYGATCIFARDQAGCFMPFPPLQKKFDPRVIEECFKYMRSWSKSTSRIENVELNQLQDFPVRIFERRLKGYEYCYWRKEIVDLKGNNYKSKRSDLNQFLKNFNASYLPYTDDMKDSCFHLYDVWAKNRMQVSEDMMFQSMLKDNRQVLSAVLSFWRQMGLVGRVVKIDDNVVGFSFGYPINEHIFCILNEVVDLRFKGLAVYIFNQFCADKGVERFPFINVMDDSFLENLKITKMSFHPNLLIPSYTIIKR